MATFKECVDSERPFRHGGRGPWMLFNRSSGTLKRADGTIMGTHSDLVTTHAALSDKWEIEQAPVNITWVRPLLMWHKTKRRYLEGREWFKSQELAQQTLHPSVVVVKWQEWVAPDLTMSFPPPKPQD